MFLRCERVRRILQASHDGPCYVLTLGGKIFDIYLNGRKETVMYPRLNPGEDGVRRPD